MVYDTLLGLDAEQTIRPQMVDSWTESDDHLTYTFTLRDKLAFSDGSPVTAEDVLASWTRWAETDGAGQMINTFLAGLDAVDAKTFRVRLKEPFGQLTYVLAKPMAMPLFVKPAKIVKGLPARTQFTDPLGSGPFIMLKDQWVAGSKVVYARNPNYVPRAEPASGVAGGKRVMFDRVEWLAIPDPATQAAALRNGEVDFIESPTLDLVPMLKSSKGVQVQALWPTGSEGTMRINWTNPPFDNPIARRAIYNFVSQPDMILAALGDPALGQVCGALLICGSPNGSEYGAELLTSKDPEDVRLKRGMEMLKEGGYTGQTIVIMDPQDQPIMHRATQVLYAAMTKAGVNVELQTMDWATLVTRRTVKGSGAEFVAPVPDHGRPARPGQSGVPRADVGFLRQGLVRLAVRCRTRTTARSVDPRDRPGEGALACRGHPASRGAGGGLHPLRPVPHAVGLARQPRRAADGSGNGGVLEHST